MKKEEEDPIKYQIDELFYALDDIASTLYMPAYDNKAAHTAIVHAMRALQVVKEKLEQIDSR